MISLKKPTFADLDYVSYLWADEDTMKDVGGTHILHKSEYERFLSKNVDPVAGDRQYFLIINDDIPIGEVSFGDYDKQTRTAMLNIKIEFTKRRKSYAKQALQLFCDYYFYEFGGLYLEDLVGNENGINFLNKIKYPCINVDDKNDLSCFMQAVMKKYNVPLDDIINDKCMYFSLSKQDYELGELTI